MVLMSSLFNLRCIETLPGSLSSKRGCSRLKCNPCCWWESKHLRLYLLIYLLAINICISRSLVLGVGARTQTQNSGTGLRCHPISQTAALWPWHFWRVCTNCSAECSSTWVCSSGLVSALLAWESTWGLLAVILGDDNIDHLIQMGFTIFSLCKWISNNLLMRFKMVCLTWSMTNLRIPMKINPVTDSQNALKSI